MTQANDDAPAVGGPPTSGPPAAAPGGAPAYGRPSPYGPQYGPPQQYGWRPPPVPLAPDGRPLADFGTRLLSHLIDVSILSGIAMIIFVPVLVGVFLVVLPDTDLYATGSPFGVSTGGFWTILLVEAGLVLLLLAGYYIYYVEMMFRRGQTVGKKMMKIQVVPLTPGTPLTRGMAAKRYLIEFPAAMVVPFFTYLDGFWQLWDKPYQQTLHDKVAKTVVVKVAP